MAFLLNNAKLQTQISNSQKQINMYSVPFLLYSFQYPNGTLAINSERFMELQDNLTLIWYNIKTQHTLNTLS